MNQAFINSRVLKLNVGFIVAEGSGFSRITTLDIPHRIRVADDLMVNRLAGELRLTRTSEGILLQGEVECTRIEECGRCLSEVEATFDLELEELFGLAPSTDNAFVVGEDGIMDLAPLLREEVFLETPIHILCRPDCKGLCPTCGHNLNLGLCDCDPQEIDPRWEALQALQKRLANR